jgi:DNA-binding CsgD family transcriptional regulator
MQQSTFIVRENKLILKTYNRELTVESNLSIDRIWQLSLDLANLALMYKKASISNYNYIWLNETERKAIYLLRQGKSRAQVKEILSQDTKKNMWRIIDGIKKKIEALDPFAEPPKPKNNNVVLYQKVAVTEIPFSALVTNEFDTDEEVEMEFGDEGKGAAEIMSLTEDKFEDSPIYQLFNDSPRAQELMLLMIRGGSRQDWANDMKVSLQEIHQKVARIKKRLKAHGYDKAFI